MSTPRETIWHSGLPDVTAINARERSSLTGHMGIIITGVGADFMTATMPVDDRTRQVHGRLNGGASVALAETVGSIAANHTVDPATQAAVGLEINANHIRPVKDGLVTATAMPEAIGRTTQVWSVRITDEQGRLVCISRLTMSVIAVTRA